MQSWSIDRSQWTADNIAHHEVALHITQLRAQSSLGSVTSGSGYLIVIVVEPGDFGVGESTDFQGWTTDSTANIENLHTILQAQRVGQIVLMARNGLVKWFSMTKSTEVEAATPAILVQISRKIVVAGSIQSAHISTTGLLVLTFESSWHIRPFVPGV